MSSRPTLGDEPGSSEWRHVCTNSLRTTVADKTVSEITEDLQVEPDDSLGAVRAGAETQLVRLEIHRAGKPVLGRVINREEHKPSESSVTRPVTNCPDACSNYPDL